MSAVTLIPAGSYVIDPTHSRIGFSARHAVITKVRGAFNAFEGKGSVKDGQASIEVTINADSIDTRQADRDGHLKSEDFFNVAAFPHIKFVSNSVKQVGEGFVVDGNLTIKDVTKPLTIEFAYTGAATDPFGNKRVGLEGEAEINRPDFGLTWNAILETGGVLVSEKIKLEFEISAIAQA
ncbi:MAG: YceI family protein [Candidatus Nanopelagicaceae bacterium]|nr:YceI family protein [Candidatus Nanopelagicaceae bacterium]